MADLTECLADLTEYLDGVKARAEYATEGPWVTGGRGWADVLTLHAMVKAVLALADRLGRSPSEADVKIAGYLLDDMTAVLDRKEGER